MKKTIFQPGAILSLLAVVVLGTGGCNQQPASTGSTAQVAETTHDDQGGTGTDDHSGWWCPEHGVPEAECSLCSSKAAEAFKAKGDWCKEHQRAESQCFLCDPSRAEKFKKLYMAKYGKEPPEKLIQAADPE